MRLVLAHALLALLLAATPARADVLAVGPEVGFTVRQIALDVEGKSQRDFIYQFVSLGVSAQAFGLREWVGVRARVSVDLYQNLSIDGETQPPGYFQVALATELMPVFTWMLGSIGLSAGTGIGFVHYFEGMAGHEQQDTLVVPAQQVLQVPVFLGVTIEAAGMLISPEIGAAYGFWYQTEANDVRRGLDDGSIEARGLDLWVRLTLHAPVL